MCAYNSSRGRRPREERVVSGMRATARKAKVIEHDLSVGRDFYRRSPPPRLRRAVPSLAVSTTRVYLLLTRASAGIYARCVRARRRLIVNSAAVTGRALRPSQGSLLIMRFRHASLILQSLIIR